MTLPTSQFRRQTTRAPRAAFVWRARDLSLNAATGQVGTLVRAATGAAADSYGASLTVVRDRPRWTMVNLATAYEGVALDMGSADDLTWTCDTKPAAASGLIDFVENGSLAGTDHIFAIANSTPTAPLLVVYSNGTQYRVEHNNASTTVTSTLSGTAPTVGQRVRLRWWLYSDGKVQIWQSINFAAETQSTVTATLALGAAWGASAKFEINKFGANYGASQYHGVVVMPGNQTQSTLLQALAY